jgi:hypothetical protein
MDVARAASRSVTLASTKACLNAAAHRTLRMALEHISEAYQTASNILRLLCHDFIVSEERAAILVRDIAEYLQTHAYRCVADNARSPERTHACSVARDRKLVRRHQQMRLGWNGAPV